MSVAISFLWCAAGENIAELGKNYTFLDWEWGRNSAPQERAKILCIYSLSRKPTKVSTNSFKIDINGISDPLEICKNIISTQILIYQPIRNFIPCSRKTRSRSITQGLP